MTLTFPAYILLLKDSSGIMYMGTAEDRWLPLFTSFAKFESFLAKLGISDCCVAELGNAQELVSFLENHPTRTGKRFDGKVVIDLSCKRPTQVKLISVQSLIFQGELNS